MALNYIRCARAQRGTPAFFSFMKEGTANLILRAARRQLELVEKISGTLHKGYHVYTGNLYSSVPLFKVLHAANKGACGTV